MTCTGLHGYGKNYLKFRSILGNGIIYWENDSFFLFNYMHLKQPDHFPTANKGNKSLTREYKKAKVDGLEQWKFNKITHAFRRAWEFNISFAKPVERLDTYNSRYGTIWFGWSSKNQYTTTRHQLPWKTWQWRNWAASKTLYFAYPYLTQFWCHNCPPHIKCRNTLDF